MKQRSTQLRRLKRLRRKAFKRRSKPVRSRKPRKRRERFCDYMLEVKRLPCAAMIVRGHVCHGEIKAHHVGPSGAGMKSHDSLVIPLCKLAHDSLHAFAGAFGDFDKAKLHDFEVGRLLQTQRYMRARGIEPPAIKNPEEAAAVARWLAMRADEPEIVEFGKAPSNIYPIVERLEDLREIGNVDVRYPNAAPIARGAIEGDKHQ